MQVVSVAVSNDSINTECCLIGHTEVKRSNVCGYSDIKIVRIDLGLTFLMLCIADLFVAGNAYQEGEQYI